MITHHLGMAHYGAVAGKSREDDDAMFLSLCGVDYRDLPYLADDTMPRWPQKSAVMGDSVFHATCQSCLLLVLELAPERTVLCTMVRDRLEKLGIPVKICRLSARPPWASIIITFCGIDYTDHPSPWAHVTALWRSVTCPSCLMMREADDAST